MEGKRQRTNAVIRVFPCTKPIGIQSPKLKIVHWSIPGVKSECRARSKSVKAKKDIWNINDQSQEPEKSIAIENFKLAQVDPWENNRNAKTDRNSKIDPQKECLLPEKAPYTPGCIMETKDIMEKYPYLIFSKTLLFPCWINPYSLIDILSLIYLSSLL